MKLLFATDRLHVPDDFSGSVQSTHALASGLQLRGHDCVVLASLPRRAKHFFATGLHRLSLKKFVPEWADNDAGYPVFRGSYWRFVERVRRAFNRRVPDVLILDSLRALLTLSSAGFRPSCPIILIVHDTSFLQGSRDMPYKEQVTIVANSPYTAAKVMEHFAMNPEIIPPIVELQSYFIARHHPSYLTLVSPHPRKGLNLVLALAERLPHLKFQLVEGWPMDKHQWLDLSNKVKHLSNVVLKRSVADMREIYKDTWILLVPSELETFGRVVVEAQVSGIPVLFNDVGALSWVAGEGGVAFSPASDISVWLSEVSSLCTHPERYAGLSRLALQNTLRSEFQPEKIIGSFETVFLARQNGAGRDWHNLNKST